MTEIQNGLSYAPGYLMFLCVLGAQNQCLLVLIRGFISFVFLEGPRHPRY
jgi:hypothetical protein